MSLPSLPPSPSGHLGLPEASARARGGTGERGPRIVDVRIETPRWSFVKGNGAAGSDFVSPFPCPFNYGSVPGTVAEDGEPEDALVLGPRIGRGELCRRSALGLVFFIDAGRRDDKLVCGAGAELESAPTRLFLRFSFTVYALAKRVQNRLRGERGRTRFEGLAVFGPATPEAPA